MAALDAGRAVALAAILACAVALVAVPAVVAATFQSLHLEHLISGVAGLAAVVGGVKFLAMAGGVTAQFVARAPSAAAISSGD